MSKANDVRVRWLLERGATQQDLYDMAEAEGATPNPQVQEMGNARLDFDDGSSIEFTWNEHGVHVRDGRGRYEHV